MRLGRSGLRVSRIGFGCAAMGGYDYGTVDDAESVAAVHRALDRGINFFDTADVYGLGHAEEILGRALAGQRVKAIIATKCGVRWDAQGRTHRDASAQWIARAINDSLRRLRTEHVDLYQLHWPDETTPLDETLKAFEALQRAGKISAIGLCNVPARFVAAAQQVARVETLQVPFSLLDRRHEGDLLACRNEHEMGLLSYNSLGQGLLSGKYDASSRFTDTDLRTRSENFRGDALTQGLAVAARVRECGNRHGKTASQVAIRWVLQQVPRIVVLTGIKRPAQVDDNAGAAGWQLTAADMSAVGN